MSRRGPYGEQLELFEGGLVTVVLPWDGRSPRALTRVALSGIFKAQAGKSVSDFVNPDQYDLFVTRQKKAPWKYQGAPSLRPLPRR